MFKEISISWMVVTRHAKVAQIAALLHMVRPFADSEDCLRTDYFLQLYVDVIN